MAFAHPNDIVLQKFATIDSEIAWSGPYDVNGTYWVAEITPENYSLVVGNDVVRDSQLMEKVFTVHELSRVAVGEIRLLSAFSPLVSKTCWVVSRFVAFTHRIFVPWTFGFLKMLVLNIGGAFLPADIVHLNTGLFEIGEFVVGSKFDMIENSFDVFTLSASAEAALGNLHSRKDYASAMAFFNISGEVILSAFDTLKGEEGQNIYQAGKVAGIFSEGALVLQRYGFPGAERLNFDEAGVQKSLLVSHEFLVKSLDRIAEKSVSLSKLAPRKAAEDAAAAGAVLNERL